MESWKEALETPIRILVSARCWLVDALHANIHTDIKVFLSIVFCFLTLSRRMGLYVPVMSHFSNLTEIGYYVQNLIFQHGYTSSCVSRVLMPTRS